MADVPLPENPNQSAEIGGPLRAPEWSIVSVAAWLVAGAIILAALYFGRDLFIPLATAFLISFALNPPVSWLTRLGLPRVVSTTLTMGAVLLALSGLGFVLTAQVRTLAIELPTYQTTILRKLSDLREA